MTRGVLCGRVPIGGGVPVSIQSMTNTDTRDVTATLRQICSLAEAGCDIVRVSVYDAACAEAMRKLCDESPVPLVADIHFDHTLAIQAVENGVQKLRLNPGNIGGEANVRRVADCAKAHGVPIRIGVNSGSVEKQLLKKHGGPTPGAMLESALTHAKMLENAGFFDIVISIKGSSVRGTIEANRMLARACDYPIHLGVTEAGLPGQGTIKSAIGIGALLHDGFGDTVRVSLSGDPVPEVEAARSILRALDLCPGVEVIACPTCGRTCVDVEGIARAVEAETRGWRESIRVAVMGCVVNGPGEAKEADVGIAGGPGGGVLFLRGEPPKKVDGDLREALLRALGEIRNGKREHEPK